MSQRALNSFYHVRKKTDVHPAKLRKVVLDHSGCASLEGAPEVHQVDQPCDKGQCDSVVTSTVDTHLPATPSSQPPNLEGKVIGPKKRQLEAHEDEIRFTIGSNAPVTSACRKLDLSQSRKKASDVVPFHKMGHLSPRKASPATNPCIVLFKKKGLLSPAKKGSTSSPVKETLVMQKQPLQAGSSFLQESAQLRQSLSQMEKSKLLSRLGPGKLAELRAKLDVFDTKSSSHRRNLFDSKPQLSKDSFTVDVVVPAAPTVQPSPVKASPRKDVVDGPPAYVRYAELAVPDKFLPIPKKYRFISEMFRNLDQIVSIKHNRHEAIRVDDLRAAMQNVTRKNFSNEYLKQIRCVFPKAYLYMWEKMLNRMGKPTGDFSLHLMPNLRYSSEQPSAPEKILHEPLTPLAKVERLKIFNHALLTIVQDHHDLFLKQRGIHIDPSKLTTWHRDFDVENLPDIDTVDFPPKPAVDMVISAQAMIKSLSGVNPRLEEALKRRAIPGSEADGQEALPSGQVSSAISTSDQGSDVKIIKGLQGLPPHLLELIKAKEKAKRIKDMTQTSQDRKQIEMLEDLLTLAPFFMNCHRSQRNGAAVPAETLFKVASDSHGRKSAKEMEELIRLFIKLVPECFELKCYDRVEYIKQKKSSPDNNLIREKLFNLLKEKKKDG